MTSLRVCYFCMSWKQQLVHQTRSLLKHQTYFYNCIYWCIITFCTRSRCSCIAFYSGLCSEARTDMYHINVCIVAYKNQPLICFAMQELCSNRIIHVHLINYAQKKFYHRKYFQKENLCLCVFINIEFLQRYITINRGYSIII